MIVYSSVQTVKISFVCICKKAQFKLHLITKILHTWSACVFVRHRYDNKLLQLITLSKHTNPIWSVLNYNVHSQP